jgi:hypothetical protein
MMKINYQRISGVETKLDWNSFCHTAVFFYLFAKEIGSCCVWTQTLIWWEVPLIDPVSSVYESPLHWSGALCLFRGRTCWSIVLPAHNVWFTQCVEDGGCTFFTPHVVVSRGTRHPLCDCVSRLWTWHIPIHHHDHLISGNEFPIQLYVPTLNVLPKETTMFRSTCCVWNKKWMMKYRSRIWSTSSYPILGKVVSDTFLLLDW